MTEIDDAQAMALVKKFRVRLVFHNGEWGAQVAGGVVTWNKDLNRSIAECVAHLA